VSGQGGHRTRAEFQGAFIDTVISIDKRILDLKPVAGSDRVGSEAAVVDAFARYRIKNALRFSRASPIQPPTSS